MVSVDWKKKNQLNSPRHWLLGFPGTYTCILIRSPPRAHPHISQMPPFPPPLPDAEGTAMASRPKRHCTTAAKRYHLSKSRGRACLACERSHKKCTGVPCDRCFRLSLRCRPPNTGPAGTSTPPQPLMELLVERHDGGAMANKYMQAFGQAHREGLIDRDLAVRLLRVWRARSILADADVTFGLAACLSKELGVLPAELEGRGGTGRGKCRTGCVVRECRRRCNG